MMGEILQSLQVILGHPDSFHILFRFCQKTKVHFTP